MRGKSQYCTALNSIQCAIWCAKSVTKIGPPILVLPKNIENFGPPEQKCLKYLDPLRNILSPFTKHYFHACMKGVQIFTWDNRSSPNPCAAISLWMQRAFSALNNWSFLLSIATSKYPCANTVSVHIGVQIFLKIFNPPFLIAILVL